MLRSDRLLRFRSVMITVQRLQTGDLVSVPEPYSGRRGGLLTLRIDDGLSFRDFGFQCPGIKVTGIRALRYAMARPKCQYAYLSRRKMFSRSCRASTSTARCFSMLRCTVTNLFAQRTLKADSFALHFSNLRNLY